MTINQHVSDNSLWYQQNYDDLCKKYPNQAILVIHKEVLKSFPSILEAVLYGNKKYGGGNFSAHFCNTESKAYIFNIPDYRSEMYV
jgi:hypothetical protein